jgi:hypothetical protein
MTDGRNFRSAVARLLLSDHALSKGESLTLTLGDHPALAGITILGIRLYGVEEAETALRLGTGLLATVVDGELVATIDKSNVADMLQEDQIYEIAYLDLSDAEGNVTVTLLGGQDFSRTYFRVKADPDEPSLTAEEAANCAREVQRRREEMYAEPLGEPDGVEAKEFRVLMFVERLLLTGLLRVPGVRLAPLVETGQTVRRSFGLGSSDELDLINHVLRDMGWMDPQASVDPSWWRDKSSQSRPVVLMHAPRVFAANSNHALQIAHNRRDRLLRLLAFHRNSSGIPFATVIQMLDPRTGNYTDAQVYFEVEQYKGNRMGGFVSGEDQSLLLADDRTTRSDPFLGFVLHLHAEAQAEKDLDFAYFRYWNLLETVAAERVERGTPVTNFYGDVILTGGGKPFTTNGARGRVYEMVKRGMQARGCGEDLYQQARDLSLGLWDAVYAWYGFRNATAHHGGFNPDDPNQQRQPWYEAAVEAQRNGAQPRGYRDDPYFGYLKEAATDVVRREMESGRKAGS